MKSSRDRSTICKSDSLGLAKPQREGCQDQSTSEDISASAGVPASKKMKKCPTSEMKCASAVNGTFHPSGPKFLNAWLWSTLNSHLAPTVTNGLSVLYVKREVKLYGFPVVMGRLRG